MKAIVIGSLLVALGVFLVRQSRSPQKDDVLSFREGPGIRIEELAMGRGPMIQMGEVVTMNYTGYLENGTKIDSTLDRKQPFSFRYGKGEVLRGWELGMEGMQVGGKRRVTLSPELAYGDKGSGNAVPPNAVLVYEFELVSTKPDIPVVPKAPAPKLAKVPPKKKMVRTPASKIQKKKSKKKK